MEGGMNSMKIAAVLAAVVAIPAASAADPLPFTISRDDWGVPHIEAATTQDLFRGQGYAAAEDRLWQAELYSRYGLGALSEVLGSFYLSADQFARGEGYTTAELDAQYAALRPETRAIIEAYTDGVNLRIAEVMADPEALLPYEFWELSFNPSPWTPRRTMAVVKYLGRQFGAAGGQELARLDDLISMGPLIFEQTYPVNDPTAPTTISQTGPGSGPGSTGDDPAALARLRHYLETFGRQVRPDGRLFLAELHERLEEIWKELALPPKFGSYAVAIAPGRAAAGRSMLLGCPQSGYPSIYEAQFAYEVDLHGVGWSVGGMATAGMPGVWIGRNSYLAWSLTSGISDNIDLYVETMNPADSREYWFNGAWVDMMYRTETIWVYGNPVPYYARRSVHGPVFATSADHSQSYSRKLAFWMKDMQFLEMLLDLNRAGTLDDVESAAAKAPYSFNLTAATAAGDIGYWHAGIFQDRQDGVDPRLPHDGRGGEEWHGLRPVSTLPKVRNPAPMYLANWNNKPVFWWDNGDNVPWVGFQRVQYIFDYLNPDPSLTFPDMMNLPPYVYSPGSYVQLVQFSTPAVAANILPPGQSGFVNRYGVYDPHFRDQFDLWNDWGLKPWDFREEATSVEAQPPAAEAGALLSLRTAAHPSRGETTVFFDLAREARVTAEVFSVDGRRVRTLGERESLAPGAHELQWDGRDDRGLSLPPGVYIVRAQAGQGAPAVAKVVRAH